MPGCNRFISEDPLGWASGQTNNYAYVAGNPISLKDPRGLTPCGGGTWDEAVGDFGISAAWGGVVSKGNVNYKCRSNPSVTAHGSQTCIGGGPIFGAAASWSLAGVVYEANDSTDLGGWSDWQVISGFNLGPVALGMQAPLGTPGGGSLAYTPGLGGGLALGKCYTSIR